MKRALITVLFTLSFLVISSPIFAVTVTISNIPESITDQPFEFKVTVNGAQPGTNFIRASFFRPETTNYFGFTWNGSDFYNGSDYSQYLPLTIDSEGSGSATVRTKIDPGSSYFKGAGDYNFKVRRYTSQSYNTSSNEVTIAINFANSTPTPTPAPTDNPTPTSTPTPSKTPTPTNPPAGRTTPTKKVSPTPTKEPTITLPPALLGTSSAVTETPSPTPRQTMVAGFSLGNILIFAGGLVFILSGILVFTFIAKREAR